MKVYKTWILISIVFLIKNSVIGDKRMREKIFHASKTMIENRKKKRKSVLFY